jgi:hypothetical protein
MGATLEPPVQLLRLGVLPVLTLLSGHSFTPHFPLERFDFYANLCVDL